MKRKIFSILLTVALVAGFSLVTAVPAAAAVGDAGSFNVAEFTLTGWGSGVAAWSTNRPHTGSYSAELKTTTESWDDMAEVKVLYNKLLTTITADTDIHYWIYTAGAQNPYAVLYLDTTGDGKVDHQLHSNRIGDITKNAWVNSAAGYQDTWILHAYDSNAPTGVQVGTAKTIAAWQTEYPNAEIIYVAIQYGDVTSGLLYVDEITINHIIYDGLIQDAINTITVTTLEAEGPATAAWSGEQYHMGNYSAKLVDGNAAYKEARVLVPYNKALSTLTTALGAGTFKYWIYQDDASALTSVLYVDTDADGDSDVILHVTGIPDGVQDKWKKLAPSPDLWAAKQISDNKWWDGDDYGDESAFSDSDSDGDTALYQALGSWGPAEGGIDQADTVLYVGAATVGCGTDTFYVDEITIGTVTYYGGDTINVAAGTYDAEVAWPIDVDKALTIQGAGVTSIIAPGSAGQGVIAISADSVTIDGFTIIHGTQSYTPSAPVENTVWVDAEYSTIKNNTITGAGGTASIYIGGRTDPDDVYAQWLYGTGTPDGHIIQDNVINHRNSSQGWGIFAVELTDSLIHGNSFTGSSDVGDGRATAWNTTVGTPGTCIIIHSATAGTATGSTGSPGGGYVVVEDNTASWVMYTFMNFVAGVMIADVDGKFYEKAVAGTVDKVIVRDNTATNIGKNSTDYSSGNIVNFSAESKQYIQADPKLGASLTIGSNKVTIGPGNTFQTADSIINIKNPKTANSTKYGVLNADNIVVIHNNLVGAESYGIYNGTTHSDQDLDSLGGDAVIVATNNWWGSASGALYANAAYDIAYGSAVTASVTYEPWLLAAAVTDVTPTTYEKTLALKNGWTLVSTNKAVADTTSDTADPVSVLKYAVDSETGALAWATATVVADLAPVDALCIKTVGGGGVGIDYSANQPGVSSKTGGLLAGWNLISSGTEENAYNILSPLPYAQIGGEQAVGLTTLVSQGSYNQFSVSTYRATLQTADWDALKAVALVPYDGYWIQMNAASDFGVMTD